MSNPLRHVAAAIVSAVLILGGALGYMTYSNFHREAELAETLMFDKGITIIRSLEVASLCAGCLETISWHCDFQKKVVALTRENDLDFLTIFDASGTVLAHSDPSLVGKQIPALATYVMKSGNPGYSFMGPDTFVVGSVFNPSSENPEAAANKNSKSGEVSSKSRHLVLVGLKKGWLKEAQWVDFRFTLLQGGILLLIGLAGFFFIFIIQSYYLTNRTLSGMTTLTENIIESMPNMLVAFDGAGKVIAANSAAEQLLGVFKGQVLGDGFHDFLGASAGSLVRRVRDGQVVLDQELLLKGEKAFPVSLTGAPLIWEGGVGAVLILRDLRELKAMEKKVQRSEKLAALGRLSAGVAHEIRNPLSSIKGFIQYFKKKFPPGSREQAYTEIMVGEVDRLNNVISNLLDFTRPKEPSFEDCDLTEVVHHALRLIQSDAQARGVEIVKRLPGPPFLARVDRDQIIQVLLNLLLNGLGAMPNGGRLEVSLAIGSHNDFQIDIADTGPGVREEDLPQLFEPFFTTKSKGTGLGLAVASQIVENHQGTISVASRLGHGATFMISLPASGFSREIKPGKAI
ncbi:MAG: ATP-binding protein [Deltaproteobacteria bacterium]|nr:ATP-binding protein [Deltaproteobacteria bacterium]